MLIKKLLEPFGFTFGQLQDISTLLKGFERDNISIEDFIEYIEDQKKQRIKSIELQKESQKEWEKRALKCPECKTVMRLYPVNTNPKDRVGNDLRSQWLCPKCWYNEFSTKTTRDWLIEINKNLSV